MKACGIIVEYNPFHNGHRYHAAKARELTGADVVIAVMSGSFLQRGEPAITDKWSRAEAALANGVDLVFELPLAWSLQSADYFARGAIMILQACGCDSVVFGTDTSDHFDYQAFGTFVANNKDKIDETFQQLNQQQLSYPEQMREVFRQLYPALHLEGTTPNHILALSYAQENAQYPQPMTLIGLPRQQAGYHDTELSSDQIASATAIREALATDKDISAYVPAETAASLQGPRVTWEDLWPLLKYRILSSSATDLQGIYQMVEGLEHRFLQFAAASDSFDEFVAAVKSKRYTMTRIQRLCCYVLLNLRESEIQQQWQQNYLHLLGFTDAGNRYLKEKKKRLDLPLYAKFGREEAKAFPTSFRGDAVYQLGNPQVPEQNFGRIPLMKKKP